MRMTRFWMTGCMALVMLAAGRPPVPEEAEGEVGEPRARITLPSRYGLDETARRVERAAHGLGWSIVAKAPTRSAQVMVWGDEAGQTPALQHPQDPLPVLPWQLWLKPGTDGRTEVSLMDPGLWPVPDGVPASTASKVSLWPAALRAALS